VKSSIDLNKDTLYEDLLKSIDVRFGGVSTDFSKYQADPILFCKEVLQETFTTDVEEMMCSVRDFPVTVARSANATGKTFAAARLAIWFYKCFPESQVFLAAAPPESNLRKLLWAQVMSVVHKHPDLFHNDQVRDLNIGRSPQSFIAGTTIPASGTEYERQARFSGKHAPALFFIFDEGDAIPPEVFTGAETCMSGGHARMLTLFNPRSPSGVPYLMERDRRANTVHLSAMRHPNVVSGEDKVPGAVTRAVVARRVNEWCRPLVGEEEPDSESFELPSFLVGAVGVSQAGVEYPPLACGHYKILNPAFAYSVLGILPAAPVNQLINREWINAARARWHMYVREHGERPPAGVSGVAGLDPAEFGPDSNAFCCRWAGFVSRLILWNGVDVVVTAERGVQEFRSRKLLRACVDSIGIGSGIPPVMRRLGVPAFAVKASAKPQDEVEGVGQFGTLRDDLWWRTREWLRTDPSATLPPDEQLAEELAIATYQVDRGRIKVMNKDTMKELLRRSPDRADSLVLTFHRPEVLFPNL
jgi:hypothetical protein